MKIENNAVVTIDYRLMNDQQEELDSSIDNEPLVYLHGSGELLDNLEQALAGNSSGDSVQITLTTEEAYGEIEEDLIRTMHMDEFNGVQMQVGMELEGKDPDGNFQILRIEAIEGDQVTVNMNHPLAGMGLIFNMEIKDVRPATEEELAHGHAHS